MITQAADPSSYADFAALDSMRRGARAQDPGTLRAVARQFESLFARMMIKSMREAVGTDPIFGSDQQKMYQGLFDDQLSMELTKGPGLGLAQMLLRQLQHTGVGPGPQPAAAQDAAAATPGATASAGAPASAARKTEFISTHWGQAQDAGAQLGVDPRTLLAQAALETDWGRSIPHDAAGRSSNNLFGVKAGSTWSGACVSAPTHEVAGATAVATTSPFRAYDSSTQSFQDYVNVLRAPRYAAALNTGSDVQAFASALQRGGYATDPDYARKLGSVANVLANTLARSSVLKLAGARPMSSQASAG